VFLLDTIRFRLVDRAEDYRIRQGFDPLPFARRVVPQALRLACLP
jgi:hypothetical protein